MPEPKLHVKPTKDELQAGIDKSLKELEATPEVPKVEPKVEPKPVTPAVVEPATPPTPPSETKPEVIPEVTLPPPDTLTPPETEVKKLKKRYTDSSREAHKLNEEKKVLSDAIDQAENVPVPTDDEMVGLYPDWDVLSDFEKKMAMDNEVNKRKFDLLHKANVSVKSINDWKTKVDKFIEDPKTLIATPDLDGRQDDFKLYAESHRGVPFDILTKSFLFDYTKQVEDENKKHKGAMFPSGSGGPATPDKTNPIKLSVEQADALRNNNYKKWKEYLKKGWLPTGTES